MEKSSEEALFLRLLLDNLLDFKQIMLMVNFGLTFGAKAENRTCWAFISDACDGADLTDLAFVSLVNNSFWLLGLLRLLCKLFSDARNQSFDSLVN
jgi:hypothetical protein